MDRRQVLFGAGATAIAFGGFLPWPVAANTPPAVAMAMFTPFDQGIRGTYTLNGSVTLTGSITPFSAPLLATASGISGGSVPAPQPVDASARVAAVAPETPTTQYAAPARAPMMSIVRVPRGSGGR